VFQRDAPGCRCHWEALACPNVRLACHAASVSSLVFRDDTKEESSSFLKKRTKKLLRIITPAAEENRDSETKVFWFFSSEKNFFLYPSNGKNPTVC
jgi:hypothetical protein